MGINGRKQQLKARWPAIAALAAFGVASAWALTEALLLLRGVPVWDQVLGLSYVQRSLEGEPTLPARLGSGFLYLQFLKPFIAAFGASPLTLLAPNLILLALECWLLFRAASKSFGPMAGLGAVLANLSSALTLVRFKSLLSFVALPLECLLVLEAFEAGLSPAWSLGLGLFMGLLPSDYEAWLLGLPLLAFFWGHSGALKRPRPLWMLAGLALGLGLVAHASLPWLNDYLAIRLRPQAAAGALAPARTLWKNLRSFFTGGQGDLYLGATAALSCWSWPFLILGVVAAWRGGRRGWLAWAGLGCCALATASVQPEAHRAILAWPALCLLCGAGFALSWERLRARPLLRTSAFAALLGLGALSALEGRLDALNYRKAHAYWGQLSQAARFLKQRQGQAPLRTLSDLNARSMAEARLLFPHDSGGPGETWVLIPRPYAPRPLDKSWGDWVDLGQEGGVPSFLLLRARPKAAEAFATRQRFLRELWRRQFTLGRTAARPALLALLQDPGFNDPWLRRACLDGYLNISMELHASVRDLVAPVLAERDPSAFALAIAAANLERLDPRAALALARRSLALDGSVDGTRVLVARLGAETRTLEPSGSTR